MTEKRERIFSTEVGDHFKVLIDSNEGHKIPFGPTMMWRPPNSKRSVMITVGSKVVNLGRLAASYGDITMEGYAHVVGFERKGKMSELWFDWKRGKLERQLAVMSEKVKHPYLLLDIPLSELWGTGSNAGYKVDDITPAVLDLVLPLVHKYKFGLVGPVTAKGKDTRRALGEYLVRVMLSHIKGEQYVPFRCLPR